MLCRASLEQAKECTRILQEQVDKLKEQVRQLTRTEREKRREEKISELTQELIKGDISRGEYESRLDRFDRQEDKREREEAYDFKV